MLGAVSPDDIAAIMKTMVKMAKEGNLKAAAMVLARIEEKTPAALAFAVSANGDTHSPPAELIPKLIDLIAVRGPQMANEAAEALGVSAADAHDALSDEAMFERQSDGYHLTAEAEAKRNAGRDD